MVNGIFEFFCRMVDPGGPSSPGRAFIGKSPVVLTSSSLLRFAATRSVPWKIKNKSAV